MIQERFPESGLIPAHAGKTARRAAAPIHARAHPRSRGENSRGRRGGQSPVGSSPLTRGKRGLHPQAARRHRLIPAHAGKTPILRRRYTCHRAHPRSRGENRSASSSPSFRVGSSPLTRGKLIAGGVVLDDLGLIPAHAGKTSSTSWATWWTWAHPRSRGENGTWHSPRSRPRGSSPLTRGKLDQRLHRRAPQGLIPAHAGKTGRRPPAYRRAWAHPRSRGENFPI